jgi:hypothetical protein
MAIADGSFSVPRAAVAARSAAAASLALGRKLATALLLAVILGAGGEKALPLIEKALADKNGKVL